MPPAFASAVEQHQLVIWELQSYATDRVSKSAGPVDLFLDRGNAEFGFIKYTSSAVAVVVQIPDTDEPMYFQAKGARAAAWRYKSRKISVLFQHLQIDLEFISADAARQFLDVLEDIAMAAGNHFFYSYEVPTNQPFMRPDFDMVKLGYTSRVSQPWMAVPADASEWPRLRKTGEWADFTVVAEGRKFPVHRVKICKESYYFKAACSGGFAENMRQSIELPEPAQTVDMMLDEMYGAYNPNTGSIFTSFALRPEIEKERIMSQLLNLFIACDKYNLEKVKRKAAEAIIDRLPFLKDVLIIVNLATRIHHEQCPQNDRGLRKVIMAHVQARLPAILEDEDAWEEFSENKIVLRAFHNYQCEKTSAGSSTGMTTPPTTPTKK